MLNSSKCFEKKKKYFFETCSLIWLIGGKVILFVYILISWWCSVLNVHFCTLCTENNQLYIFVYNLGAHTMLGTVRNISWKFWPYQARPNLSELKHFCQESWSTHFAWNSNTNVYSSHCICILLWIVWLAKWAWAKLNRTVHSTVHMIDQLFLLHCTCTADWRKHGFSIVNKSQKMLEDDGNGLATW